MKNRRKAIMSFLLVACLVMGLGYAAFSDTMTIDGTADLNAENIIDGNIIFTSAVASNAVDGDTASVNANNPDKASFSCHSVVSAGQTATFTYTITNTNTDAYRIRLKATPSGVNTDATNHYAISAKVGTANANDITDATGYVEIAGGGGTLTVVVTLTMTSTPSDTSGAFDASFLIELLVSDIA